MEIPGEVGAQHPHLDVARHVELRLHALVRRGGCLQLLDVVGDGVLHVYEAVVQAQHLVLAGDLGQLGLEVAFGHVQCGNGQFGDGARHAADHAAADEEENNQMTNRLICI